MEVFEQDIALFQRHGTYEYKFDEGGNLVFNIVPTKFQEKYVALPLINFKYDADKIQNFHNIEFTEFMSVKVEPSSSVVTSNEEVIKLNDENQQLKTKLAVLTETSDANITESERLAIKQIIIELRIQLKQGFAERDFSTTFPYLPFTKTN